MLTFGNYHIGVDDNEMRFEYQEWQFKVFA